jgi:hypothetical protein
MKKIIVGVAAVSILALLFAVDSYAQMGPGFKWHGSGGWGMGTPYQRQYDPAKVETINGTVEAVEMVTPMKGMYKAVALMVKTGSETIAVHLGPEWYIGRLDVKILKGDTVEVKGSRISFAGKPAIIAAEIKKGDTVLVLRNEAGIPVWAGWRRQ